MTQNLILVQVNKMRNSTLLHSTFLFFLCTCSHHSVVYSSASPPPLCPTEQSLALLQFKQNLITINDSHFDSKCHDLLGSHYSRKAMTWNGNTDCCSWDGVTCNQFTGDVIGLDLSCNKLHGTIDSDSALFHLPHLQRLNLAFNNFNGSHLPRKITSFANSMTHLNLSHSYFKGEVPSEISLLSRLVSLDLSHNLFDLQPQVFDKLLQNSMHLRQLSLGSVHISMVLPADSNVFHSLRFIDLSNTGLYGELPGGVFGLPYLQKLILSNNTALTGALPIVNRNTSNSFKWLDLSNTGLSGEIIDSIGHLTTLSYLDLSNCSFVGRLPKSLIELTQLTVLRLSWNQLNGTMPSWLFTLPLLEEIALDNNKLSGDIPSELFTLRSLRTLSLGSNQLIGQIDVVGSVPRSFLQLINLLVIDLSFNNFTGTWDLDALFSSLTNLHTLSLSYSGLSVFTSNANPYVNPNFHSLRLASCKLTVFPEFLRAMKNLRVLDLSKNEIHGHIPDWVVEIGGKQLWCLNLSHNSITGLPKRFHWERLEILCLKSNLIQGPFPPSIGNMCKTLGGLSLNKNLLQGEVPRSLAKCLSLEILDLGNNRLNGTFPAWLGDLPKLQVLVLRSNKFHGALKSTSVTKFPFPKLRILDVSQNEFVGHLPGALFTNFKAMRNIEKNGTELNYMRNRGQYYSVTIVMKDLQIPLLKIFIAYAIVDISSNKIKGEIPDIIGSLNSLKALNLSHNNFSGQIPRALGNLSEIESLDLSWNQLMGEIPQQLAALPFLEVFNLSQNHLAGPIPQGHQFDTFKENSYVGNPELCGFPLPRICEHNHSAQPYLPHLEDDADAFSGFTWQAVVLGYSCGTLLGLVMGYLVSVTRRPKWLNEVFEAAEQRVRRRQKKINYVNTGRSSFSTLSFSLSG